MEVHFLPKACAALGRGYDVGCLAEARRPRGDQAVARDDAAAPVAAEQVWNRVARGTCGDTGRICYRQAAVVIVSLRIERLVSYFC